LRAIVNVYLKEGVLDPQGKAVHHALETLNFKEVKDVRIGKQIIMDLNEYDRAIAKTKVEKMAEELLANTVIEDFDIEIIE